MGWVSSSSTQKTKIKMPLSCRKNPQKMNFHVQYARPKAQTQNPKRMPKMVWFRANWSMSEKERRERKKKPVVRQSQTQKKKQIPMNHACRKKDTKEKKRKEKGYPSHNGTFSVHPITPTRQPHDTWIHGPHTPTRHTPPSNRN